MSLAEKLEAAVRKGNAGRCRDALRGRSEEERKEAWPAVRRLFDEIKGTLQFAQSHAVSLAVHGTAPLSELRTLKGVLAHEYVYEVMADRKPEWLASWSERACGSTAACWSAVRRMVFEGMIPRPESEQYMLGFITGFGRPKLEKWAAAEPDILEYEIWRLFEIEGTQEASLAQHDKFSGNGWSEGLAALAKRGKLDRGRLLDASLEALGRDFSPFRASWFSRFHERLEPTLDEQAARARTYLGLLTSSAPATVAFALKAVVRLDKAKRDIDPENAASFLAGAVASKQKGVALQALALLESIAKRAPGLKAEAGRTAESALAHESPEVQKAAWETMKRLLPAAECETLAAPYRETMAPSMRSEAPVAAAAAEPACRREPTAIRPIEDLDELVETFAAVLENNGPAEDIERVLGGVARLCGERPRRFEALTKPLAARAAKILGERSDPFTGHLPNTTLAGVALSWLRGERFAKPETDGTLAECLGGRAWEIAEQARCGESKPLLAEPTHGGGWIDPAVFEARKRANPKPHPLDAWQAQLRLGPAGRAANEPKPAEMEWHRHSNTQDGKVYVWYSVALASEVSPGTKNADMLRWCALVSPAERESWCTVGVRAIGNNIDWWSAEWENRVYLDTLAAQEQPYGPMAVRLLALGLACKESGEGMAAVDALVGSLSDGRLAPADLAKTCAELAMTAPITLSRWAKRFGTAAVQGPHVARAVCEAVDAVLATAADIAPRDKVALLELLHEQSIVTRHELSRIARLRLQAVPKSGKAGKLARSILTLASDH